MMPQHSILLVEDSPEECGDCGLTIFLNVLTESERRPGKKYQHQDGELEPECHNCQSSKGLYARAEKSEDGTASAIEFQFA